MHNIISRDIYIKNNDCEQKIFEGGMEMSGRIKNDSYGILLNKMHDIQETYGFIPESEISKLAAEFDMPKAQIYGVIRFYSMFYTEPTGKYIVKLCDSLSCHINQSKEVLKAVQNFLDIETGETTKNKMFTLEVVECLGYCGEGPVMMVNNNVYTHVDKNKALKILNRCV